MSDNNSIQIGDEGLCHYVSYCWSYLRIPILVSWNWGGGHPTGVVKEMKSSGKLEIESSGKRVHRNADEDNPAVHVERGGNNVVKRASELHRTRGGGAQDTTGETDVQEGEEPKKATRGGRKAKQSTGETRKKQSEGGKKGGATTAAKKGGRKRGRAVAAEEAMVGEKREREGVVEEKGEKAGEDVDMEKGQKEKVEVASVIAEQEKAEKEAGKEAKKARTLAEEASQGPSELYVPRQAVPGEEEKEKERRQGEEKVAELTAAEVRASASGESKELERDNHVLEAAGSHPRRGAAAQSGSESIVIATADVLEAGAGEKPPSEKKRGGRKGRGKAH